MTNSDQKSTFEHLLKRNRGRLAAIARTYADGDADDLLQEILLQTWRSLNGFQQRSSIDTWCYRVLMYLDDLSGSEMSEITGLSEGAVRVRVHRIKCRLAKWNAGDL